MNYEMFLQGPEVYIPIILVSLAITLIAYGAFPLIFAKMRKAPITKKKYRWICFGVNIAVMLGFIIVNGEANGGPYFLWTWIFSNRGIKILGSKGVLTDWEYLADDPNRIIECKSCGYRDKNFFNACPQCGKYAKQYVYLNQEQSAETDGNGFCRNCGEKLIENSKFCRKCGAEVK